MVSWVKKEPVVRSAFDKFGMEPLAEPETVRLRFRKVGDLQYISHLDLQRVWGRILIRSGVPIWFTQGFNPHPKIVFAMPLSIGAQSECEYVDIKIDRKISLMELAERINAQVTDEMRVTEVYRPKTKFSEIGMAAYRIEIDCDGLSPKTAADSVKLLTSSPLMVMKRSKSGEKEVDLTSYVKGVTATYSDSLKLDVKLVGGEGSLNPEAIVSVLRERLGVLSDYPDKGGYTITRTELYFADGTKFQ